MSKWTVRAVAGLAAAAAGLIIHAGNPSTGPARVAAVVAADANGSNFDTVTSAVDVIQPQPQGAAVLTGGPTYAHD
ncbi:hypothetical protein [Streptacidiphilus jiangxiensis]|uniref:Uncharacterized protein n=1 Tax=Streptacidiphilus jiangxiensis TaxID=235985 RepID=A0A1H7HL04_STRJI|nr:hypothetical protein [Streptacidiphilus jiangxiensis]SEK51096.1 hypothetical protein SAMN05414137_102263 [Streptacidiphilus jiangxiensis]